MKEYRKIPIKFLEISREQNLEGALFESQWCTPTSLARRLGNTSDYVIKKIAKKHADDRPDWIRIEAGDKRRVTYYAPELVEIISDEYLARPKAPEGWYTYPALAKVVGRSIRAIENSWNRHREDHPEWFEYYNRKGKLSEHCAPELVAIIIARLGGLEKAPEGWKTVSSLSRQFGVSESTVKRKIDSYRNDRRCSDWFKFYSIANGHTYEHLSPNLVNILVEEFSKYKSPPDGWRNVNSLSTLFKKSHPSIIKIAERYRESNPEWFMYCKEPRSIGKRVCGYYAPELVEAIKNEATSYAHAPNNWETANALSVRLRVSDPLVRKITEPFRSIHPEWFDKYKSRGKIIEYYSPGLVAMITQEIVGLKTPPEGWLPLGVLATMCKKSKTTIIAKMEKYRSTHPEWFRKFLIRTNKCEFYSPEIIEIIMHELAIPSKSEDNSAILLNQRPFSSEEADEMIRKLLEEE